MHTTSPFALLALSSALTIAISCALVPPVKTPDIATEPTLDGSATVYSPLAGNGCDPTIGPLNLRGEPPTSILYGVPEDSGLDVDSNAVGVVEIHAPEGSAVSISEDEDGDVDRTVVRPGVRLDIVFLKPGPDSDGVVEAEVRAYDRTFRWPTTKSEGPNGASLHDVGVVDPKEPRRFAVRVSLEGRQLQFWMHEDSIVTHAALEASAPNPNPEAGDSEPPVETDPPGEV